MKIERKKYKRNESPPKEHLEKLYETKTLQEIADFYYTTKTRVRKWFDTYSIKKNCRGGGNNHKHFERMYSKEYLQHLLETCKTNRQVLENLDCSNGSYRKLLEFYGLETKHKNPPTSKFTKYARKVRHLTEKNYSEFHQKINPQSHPRTLCGVEGGYQLDHIKSIKDCFDAGDTIEFCSSLNNLQMIPWEKNLEKRYNNE